MHVGARLGLISGELLSQALSEYISQSTNSVNQTTYTFSGQSIGSAVVGRFIICAVMAGSSIPTSVTIGGVSASYIGASSDNVGLYI